MQIQCTRNSGRQTRPCATCDVSFYPKPQSIARGGKVYCSRSCWRNKPRPSASERFWSKVNKNGPIIRPELGPCWLRSSAKHPDRRGCFYFEGSNKPAPVVAYILTYGPLPTDKPWALHHCDNPPCVRPDHLFPGTNDDNVADMLAKGRHWSSTHPEMLRGTSHHLAKVTDAIVVEARTRYTAGGVSIKALAAWAGVSSSTMRSIIRRQTWTHVT